jgi:hypothetical protein
MKGRDYFEGLSIDVIIILKGSRMVQCGLDSSGSGQSNGEFL